MSPEKIKQLVYSNFDITGTLEIEDRKVIASLALSLKKDIKFYSGRLPISFKSVNAHFLISSAKLTTLEGCPNFVGTMFNCSSNELTDLIGGPKNVGASYICGNNPLTSLDGLPDSTSLFRVDIGDNLPIIKLIIKPYKIMSANQNLTQIITTYQNYIFEKTMTRKEAILACQKELIENGYIGNAKW